ncbi:hypothetical protein V1525DRAFT_407370 [Lipomyces kononenkoae]|uniref:Uncharacterized protein n=1 Tax=Lipomyces kononenkoae TaxID=34357 RepID=A0ACC3SXG3_LIPKO
MPSVDHSSTKRLDLYLISEADLPYEHDLLRYPHTLAPWMRYIEHKSESPIHEQVFVYERACRDLGRSYKVWKLYLDLRVKHLDAINPAKYEDEFVKVNECFERALMMLSKMPRLWIDYLQFLMKQCRVTETRRAFDRALRALPLSQHERIWPLYLNFAKSVKGSTAVCVYKRYLQYKPQDIEDYIDLLTSLDFHAEAAQQYIELLNAPKFVSKNGKSQFQIWTELTDLLVHYARDIRDYLKQHPATHPNSFDTEKIIRSGIDKFSDQRGKLWVNLAMYKIAIGDFEGARDAFEEGVTTVMTVRDFTLIFDSYAEFEESVISSLMGDAEKREGEMDDEKDAELDIRMMRFEHLMDRRPFLLNDVLLRQNPNNVVEWEKRVGLWGNNAEQVVKTYTDAIATINPKKAAVGHLYKLWTNFAKFYEGAGDLRQARVIFERGAKVPFKSANELADLYIEWAEMELRSENFDRAVDIMAKATSGPQRSNVDFFNEDLTPQQRLHKSMKLWSFYVDLVESVGTLEQTRKIYDRIFELKIATPLTIVNYANLLEENKFFEESFKVYERGVELFSYPVAFELWNLYLTKAMHRKLNIERLRDLFEQALEKCPPEFAKPLYLLYGELEETRGLARNAMQVYDRATTAVSDKDRANMYRFFIKKTADTYGIPATRTIYERALESLPDGDCRELCIDFAEMEQKLGEIDRARGIWVHGSQFADPRIHPRYWDKWHEFEVLNGSEETFKEMLRIKRAVQAQYSTDVNFIAAETAAKTKAPEKVPQTEKTAVITEQPPVPSDIIPGAENEQNDILAGGYGDGEIALDMDY